MSDLMLKAVLRMPYEMAMADELSRRQFYDRAQQALDLAESLQEHDDELIEKCAKVCESINKYTQFQTVEDYKLVNEAARNIRALKEVK